MKKLARAWFRKVEGDLRAARIFSNIRPAVNDSICFHCQEAAEKFLKALIAEFGLPIPELHFTEDLLQFILPYDPTLQVPVREMKFLSVYSVPFYYHDSRVHATSRDAKAAVRWAEDISEKIRKRLKLGWKHS